MISRIYFNLFFAFTIASIIVFSEAAFSQAVSINSTGAAPDAQSILDVSSTSTGVLLPRMTSAERTAISTANSTDHGLMVYDIDTDSYWYWDGAASGSWKEIPNTDGVSSSLDEAYDNGGSGAGRIITGDEGPVVVSGTQSGNGTGVALEIDGGIQVAEDEWIGIGSTVERIEFDGSLNRIDIESADLTMNDGKWIGIDASSPRIEFEDASGRLNMQNADVQLDDGAWVGINASNPRILFEGGTTDKITLEDADIQIDNDRWFGLGSTIERFVFQGTDNEVNLMGAEFGIGTLAPTNELDVNGQIRMRTGATAGYIPVSNGTGVMTWTDPTTITTADVTLDEAYDGNGSGLGRTITADNGAVYINGSDGLAVNGNVGIGTTDQSHRLIVSGSSSDTEPIVTLRSGNENTGINDGAQLAFGYNNTDNYSHFIQTRHNSGAAVNNAIDFYLSNSSVAANSISSGSVRVMTLEGTGNVGIGVANPSVKFQVAGDATISGKFNSNGIQESSDVRFKKNIQPLSDALSNVMKLEGVSYNWKQEEFPEKNFGDQTEIGVIAQEIEKIYPELVNTDKDGYKSVQYSHIVPVLIEAIKEQQQLISQLETTVSITNNQLSSLESNLNLLVERLSKVENESTGIGMTK